jgi:hypothetical protein
VKSSGTSQVALISTNEVTSTSDTSPTADQSSATVTAPESTIPTTPTICNFNSTRQYCVFFFFFVKVIIKRFSYFTLDNYRQLHEPVIAYDHHY